MWYLSLRWGHPSAIQETGETVIAGHLWLWLYRCWIKFEKMFCGQGMLHSGSARGHCFAREAFLCIADVNLNSSARPEMDFFCRTLAPSSQSLGLEDWNCTSGVSKKRLETCGTTQQFGEGVWAFHTCDVFHFSRSKGVLSILQKLHKLWPAEILSALTWWIPRVTTTFWLGYFCCTPSWTVAYVMSRAWTNFWRLYTTCLRRIPWTVIMQRILVCAIFF